MSRFSEFIGKFLHPRVKAMIIIDAISIPLVIAALKLLSGDNPISLAAYLLSAYALTVTVINFKKIKGRIKELATGDELSLVRNIKSFMRRYKYTRLYLESLEFRAEVGLYSGLAVNMLYAVFKCASGAYYSSAWLWSLGIYYFFLGGIRFFLMRGVRIRASAKEARSAKLHEYKTYRLCGCLMMILDLSVAGMAVQMIWQNKANEFSRFTVIASAAFTFYFFILSVYNVVKFRRIDNAILSAAKNLAFTGALMSMFSLQTSMLHVFSTSNEERFRRIMNTATGGVVMAAVLAIATYMIISSSRKINEYEGSDQT